MARITGWLGELIDELNWGCANSPYIRDLESKSKSETLARGQELCLILWPFLSSLPSNVTKVRNKLPLEMVAAQKFFDQLKDDEGYYQGLYIKQCKLVDISEERLRSVVPDEKTHHLCRLMNQYCSSDDYNDGVLAIVTAELAATCYARHSQSYWEKYFESIPAAELSVSLDEGLAWLRLHAKPHHKHAIWLKRTIEAIDTPSNKLPETVEKLVDAIHQFLRSDRAGRTQQDQVLMTRSVD